MTCAQNIISEVRVFFMRHSTVSCTRAFSTHFDGNIKAVVRFVPFYSVQYRGIGMQNDNNLGVKALEWWLHAL